MDGTRIADVIRRINLYQVDSNWLSLDRSRVGVVCAQNLSFGEINQYNKLDGRGICIFADGTIDIRYFNNGYAAPGNYLRIHSYGEFKVGEMYLKDGKRCYRGT